MKIKILTPVFLCLMLPAVLLAETDMETRKQEKEQDSQGIKTPGTANPALASAEIVKLKPQPVVVPRPRPVRVAQVAKPTPKVQGNYSFPERVVYNNGNDASGNNFNQVLQNVITNVPVNYPQQGVNPVRNVNLNFQTRNFDFQQPIYRN